MSEENINNEGGQDEGGQEQNWRSGLTQDLQDNPTMQKYATAEDAHRGHLELVKSFGKDKVVWPTDANDTAGWANIHQKLGVPESSDGYNLEAVQMPEGGGVFNKGQFQDMMKQANAPKATADALWKSYTETMNNAFSEAETSLASKTNAMMADLKQEWGEAYNTNIDRAQSVIDTFAGSKENAQFLTAQLAGDARGQKFLADLGAQFAENSIGGFQEKSNFTLTPQQARDELAIIKANPDYRSDNERVRMPLVDRANELMRLAGGQR